MAVNYNYINDNSNHIRNAAINRAMEMHKHAMNSNNNKNNNSNHNNTSQNNYPHNHRQNNHAPNRNEQVLFPNDMVIKVSDEQPNPDGTDNHNDNQKDNPKPDLNFGKIINDLLKGIIPSDGKFDSEKIFILALIFIMAKEGADLKLLLALAYILL